MAKNVNLLKGKFYPFCIIMYRFLFICVLGVFSEDSGYFEYNDLSYEIGDISKSGSYSLNDERNNDNIFPGEQSFMRS